jgi:hypothetical protein
VPGSTLLARLDKDRVFWIMLPWEALAESYPFRSGSMSNVVKGFAGELSENGSLSV